MNTACLVLEDGSYYFGQALGKESSRAFGELVFNTGITGYQEILTDPSYAKQNVILTYPEIGNYGFSKADDQSRKVFASGLVIKNVSPLKSSWRSDERELDDYLKQNNTVGIYGLDTRSITRKIRSQGAMRSIISTEENLNEASIKKLIQEVQSGPSMNGMNLASEVTLSAPLNLSATSKKIGKVVVLDFGLKYNMLNLLRAKGMDLVILPADSGFEEIKKLNPDGVFLSNGPGDPSACSKPIETVKRLIAEFNKPIFGVCLGHQILSIASGASSYKLKFGHRGCNHPVQDLTSKRILITSQNHGFAIDEKSLDSTTVKVTHKSLNDDTIEGIEFIKKPIFSVQFHPEACPGPQETEYLFDKFVGLIERNLSKVAA
jgi:carbamoyl-phosphate synthase small subunit